MNKMQWFFLFFVTLWAFAAMALSIITLWLTKNPLYLSGFTTLAPPVYILCRIARYLFPKNDKDYHLEEIKILCAAKKI